MNGKFLFFQWNAFMQKGIENALKRANAQYDVFTYYFKDWDCDDYFKNILREKLKKDNYKFVFSVNFAPLISDVCAESGILYISWVYDAPIHIRRTQTLREKTNRIYFFDRVQAEEYKSQGLKNVSHLPLAVDTDIFNVKNDGYKCDVSFVGQLYKSDFNYLCGPLDFYLRGYLEGLVNAQIQVKQQGGYILHELITDELIDKLNVFYKKASGGKFSVDRKEVEYAMACEVTGRQRFMALALLQNRCRVDLYSKDMDTRLSNVNNRGYADYYTQMPEVFKTSRINLNISLSIIQSGIPLRVLDVLGSRGFLITNFQPELQEYFIDGKDIVIYYDIEDMISKVRYYLEHEDERLKICDSGYKKAKELFSFDERVLQLGLV